MDFNYDLEVCELDNSVKRLKSLLEVMILGKSLPAKKSGYSALSYGVAKAVKIIPAGNFIPHQATIKSLWNVKMVESNGNKEYYCGLLDFLDSSVIEDLFNEHFKGVDSQRLSEEYFKMNDLEKN